MKATPKKITNWTSSLKYRVMFELNQGLFTRTQVMLQYNITDEELDEWIALYKAHGKQGLKVSLTSKRRRTK